MMCFLAYIGTERPLQRKAWDKASPNLCVESLTEQDSPIRAHFTKPEVQYVGSTSGCGCDFPHISLQNGAWPFFADDDEDAEWDAKDRDNRKRLVDLLRKTGEEDVEFYGVWDGDFSEAPKARESISLDTILDPSFMFKEQGFYRIEIGVANHTPDGIRRPVDGSPKPMSPRRTREHLCRLIYWALFIIGPTLATIFVGSLSHPRLYWGLLVFLALAFVAEHGYRKWAALWRLDKWPPPSAPQK